MLSQIMKFTLANLTEFVYMFPICSEIMQCAILKAKLILFCCINLF